MKIRLNKFLAEAGVASRRKADRLIIEGRVKVNYRVVQELGTKIDDSQDLVEVDGKIVRRRECLVYLMLNKPSGYLVSVKDPSSRPTILSLLPPLKERIFPIGRLDFESEGLLLLTNDGQLAFRLTHPRYEVKKVYLVELGGEVKASELILLERGIFVDGKRMTPDKASLIFRNPKKTILKIELHEGRKREIRRMCEAIGHRVLKLKRISFAGLKLDRLRTGQWRFLKPGEVMVLRRAAGMK